MELALTLEELFETYAAIKEQQVEEFKLMARANGAELKEDEESDPDAFSRVMDEVRERSGVESGKTPDKAVGLFKITNI